MKLAAWSTGAQSSDSRHHRLSASGRDSAIATDAVTYASGDDMTLTVTLKDAQANPVTGAQLTAATVTAANASLKAGSSWSDNGDGTYAATDTAQNVGTASWPR